MNKECSYFKSIFSPGRLPPRASETRDEASSTNMAAQSAIARVEIPLLSQFKPFNLSLPRQIGSKSLYVRLICLYIEHLEPQSEGRGDKNIFL